MTTDEGIDHDGIVCSTPDCGGRVEASLTAGFTLYRDGSWELTYMGDDHGVIVCDACAHDNYTTLLDKSLTAYVEMILPGTTWQGSDPQHPLDGSVDVELSPVPLAFPLCVIHAASDDPDDVAKVENVLSLTWDEDGTPNLHMQHEQVRLDGRQVLFVHGHGDRH